MICTLFREQIIRTVSVETVKLVSLPNVGQRIRRCFAALVVPVDQMTGEVTVSLIGSREQSPLSSSHLIKQSDVRFDVTRLLDQEAASLFQHVSSLADVDDSIVDWHLEVDSETEVHVGCLCLGSGAKQPSGQRDNRIRRQLTSQLRRRSCIRCPSGL